MKLFTAFVSNQSNLFTLSQSQVSPPGINQSPDPILIKSVILSRWKLHVRNKLHENRPVEKLHENNSLLRQLARALLLPVESRNLIVTGLVQSRFVRSVVTRNPPSCWSASCPSSVLCEKSLKISRQICVSRARLWWLFKKLARLTLLVCLKTPTCAPSTPSVSRLCPRTFSWHAESAENEHKWTSLRITNGSYRSHHINKSSNQTMSPPTTNFKALNWKYEMRNLTDRNCYNTFAWSAFSGKI